MAKRTKPGGIGFTAENSHGNSRPKSEKAAHLSEYRWPKGRSGNPGGRPKDTPFTTAMKQLAQANPQVVRAIAVTMYEAAQNKVEFCNPVMAAKFITQQVEGRVPLALTGPEGGPIQIQPTIDLSRLNDEQLSQLRGLVESAQAANAGGDRG